jgi:hypothetical protein
MPFKFHNIPAEQRNTAIQRLTALWAFCESGLGGVMHALQMPFTGLVLGGMAVIIITIIADLSDVNVKQMLHSLVIVLIIKAMVSPYTPFPAYLAVSFQAILGIALFYFLGMNFISILLLSLLAMLESALQQLLILTLFFGRSFWKALDQMLEFIARQFGLNEINGSHWVIGLYLAIYLLGGLFIALMAHKVIRGFFSESQPAAAEQDLFLSSEPGITLQGERKNKFNRLWTIAGVLIMLSLLLFLFAPESKNGWIAVLKTVSWTLSAIIAWYLVISPLFTKFILRVLQKKQSRYHEEVAGTLSIIPVLRKLTVLSWQRSNTLKGWNRWYVFISTLLHWSLTYTEAPAVNPAIKKEA